MENAERRNPLEELAALDEAMAETRRRSGPIRDEAVRLSSEARQALEWLAVALGRAQQPPQRDSDAA